MMKSKKSKHQKTHSLAEDRNAKSSRFEQKKQNGSGRKKINQDLAPSLQTPPPINQNADGSMTNFENIKEMDAFSKEIEQLKRGNQASDSDTENVGIVNEGMINDKQCDCDEEDEQPDLLEHPTVNGTDVAEDKSMIRQAFSSMRKSFRRSKRQMSSFYESFRVRLKKGRNSEKATLLDDNESAAIVPDDVDDISSRKAEEEIHALEFKSLQPEDDEGQSIEAEQPVYGATGEEDVESVISKKETDYCDSNGPAVLELEALPVTRPSIRALYNDPEKVYQMSNVIRGRVLILNNFYFFKNGICDKVWTRYGTGADYENIARMFKRFHFDIAKSQRELSNLSKVDMLNAIKEETQRPEHHQYGMFVLVVMSHGKEGHMLYDSNCELVSLGEMQDLLSASEFPAMRGKPKLIIVVACSGDKPDDGRTKDASGASSSPFSNFGVPLTAMPTTSTDGVDDDASQKLLSTSLGGIEHLNADDFFVMKGSSEYPTKGKECVQRQQHYEKIWRIRANICKYAFRLPQALPLSWFSSYNGPRSRHCQTW